MTDEQLLNEVKKIFPNYELGKPLDYKEFEKHKHELFDLLSNEIENRRVVETENIRRDESNI